MQSMDCTRVTQMRHEEDLRDEIERHILIILRRNRFVTDDQRRVFIQA